MEACLLLVEDDAETDPHDGMRPSNESTRTATPLSFQTFGGHDSPHVQTFNGTGSNTNNVDHLPIPDNINPTRPSLDSFQSSSPSTAPPTTPTRMDGSESTVGNTSPTSPLTMSDPPTTPESASSRLLSNPVEKSRTLRSRREFRMFDKGSSHDFKLGASGTNTTSSPDAIGSAASPGEYAGTARRTNLNKRKPRPKLGVATFGSSNGTNSPGSGIVEPSPLSPVIASPRSNRTGGPPGTPSIPYTPQSPTPHSMDGIITMEPMSPDVTLDPPESQDIFMPGANSPDPSALISPFGTTFITETTTGGGLNRVSESHAEKSPETPKGGAKLQYKPRRRIPTPRRRSAVADGSSLPGSAEPRAPGNYRVNNSIANIMDAGDAAPPLHEQDRPLGGPEADGKGRRPSFSKWSFGNPDGGIGKGMMKRLSRLRSSSELRPDDSGAHAVKSAVDPKPPPGSPFVSHDGSEYRGYASEGVITVDATAGLRRIMGSGVGARLSKILPLPFPARRQSLQQQQQSASANVHAHMQDEDDGSAHLWATVLNRTSIPAARAARSPGAGSARGSASADGAHRHSTITVRSSDGWFSTVPTASASLSPPGNGSPTSAHFPGLGHDISRQHSPSSLNPSRTSLTPPVPPSAFPPHTQYHSVSDLATPILGSLSAVGASDASDTTVSRRHSEQTAPVTAADRLKSSSQRGSLNSAHSMRSRPQSLQHAIAANGSSLPDSQAKTDLLNGIQHGPDSVRLLDVETAAAIRRSIDFEDRVRKGENVLRRALYGSESSASPSSSSRASSFSMASAARGRGRNAKATERSSSMSGQGVVVVNGSYASSGSVGPGSRRSGSVDHVQVGRNGLLTGGGVFLPSAMARSSATRYTHLNGSFHSTSSSGLSTLLHHPDLNGSGILRGGLNSASGTLTRGSSTLREGQEESFGVGIGSEKYASNGGLGVMAQTVHVQQSPTLANRVGRRISRIFVGKGTVSQ